MTEQLEQRLATGFREYAAGVRLDTDLVGAAAARNRRRTTVRRAMFAGGGIGVAAALSAVLVVGNTGRPPADGQPPPVAEAEAGTQAPALKLAAAAQATAQTSFRVRLTRAQSYETGRLKGYSVSEEYDGAFDAAADRGYLRVGPSRVRGKVVGTPAPIELRILGEDVYLGRLDTNSWKRRIPRSDLAEVLGTANPATSSIVNDLTVDPRGVQDMLRHLGTISPAGRSGSGSNAVDTYTFTYQVKADASIAAHQVTGSVKIGVESHLLAGVTQQTTTVGADPAVADGEPLTWRTVIEFADYGTAVHVEKPVITGK
jgi:hypothetical protein